MQIQARKSDGITVLDIDGRMTRNEGYGTVKREIGELLAADDRQFVLNLAEVPYMDSTCVGELVSAFITVRNNGGVLKLSAPTPRIRELFSVAKLDTVFEVYDSESAAIQSFSKP